MRTLFLFVIAVATAQPALAATLRVPQDHKTIQAGGVHWEVGQELLGERLDAVVF
jgi:hypothetical protein